MYLSGYVEWMKGCDCSSESSGLLVLMEDVLRNSICDLFHILKASCGKRFFMVVMTSWCSFSNVIFDH